MKLLAFRDNIWNYPYTFFIGRNSYWQKLKDFYASTRPFSYIATTISLSVVIGTLLLTQANAILGFSQDHFVEGIIVGTNAAGNPVGPSNLNPIQVIKPQLDQDIIELVYEPLIRVEQDQSIVPVLAENYTTSENKTSRSFRFSLRKDVKWHDGSNFTAVDVKATFDLIKTLSQNNFSGIYASNAAKNMKLEVLSDYICEFTIENEVIPNIFEILTFKILPGHMIQQYRDAVEKLTGVEELTTIGTGPFILNEIRSDEVILTANANYYKGQPQISRFSFRLLRDQEEAIRSLRSGQIHAIANISNDVIKSLSDVPNFEIKNSNIIYTQYWGIYFDFSANGPKQLKEKAVRQAFSYAINRELAIQSVFDKAEAAYGPIPEISPYYADRFQQPHFNRRQAETVLDKAGWVLSQKVNPATGNTYSVRAKAGQELRFTLSFADNPDRFGLVASIVSDLESIGIIIEPKPTSTKELIKPGQQFELLLVGVSTFIDPDRYELFHSSQAAGKGDDSGAGLNLGSYASEKTTLAIIEGAEGKPNSSKRIPTVDKLLDDARKITDQAERKEKYTEFQQLLADEVPVVFLYHPSIRYVVNKRIKNVKLDKVSSLEDRFSDIVDWQISFNN